MKDNRQSFTFGWSNDLGEALKANTEAYPMRLIPDDADVVMAAVNQGIDAHLEACFVPDRGDSYEWSDTGRLNCNVSPESLPVLIRRLLESGDENAEYLASGICETLDIELV